MCAFSILYEEGLRFRLLRRVDFGQIVLIDPPSKDAEGAVSYTHQTLTTRDIV